MMDLQPTSVTSRANTNESTAIAMWASTFRVLRMSWPTTLRGCSTSLTQIFSLTSNRCIRNRDLGNW